MKKKANKKPTISTAWLIALTVVLCLGIAVFTNKTVEFNNINTNKLTELYKAKEKSIIYIGRADCSYCQKYAPILKKVAAKYDLTINYYDLATVTDENEYAAFTKLDEYFGSGTWGTPLVVITDNGKLIESKINGLQSESYTIEYFKDQGFIK